MRNVFFPLLLLALTLALTLALALPVTPLAIGTVEGPLGSPLVAAASGTS